MALLAPPTTPVEPAGDWEEAERELGLRFPPDHRALLERYGAGRVGGEFGWLDPREVESYGRWAAVFLFPRELYEEARPGPPLPGFPDDGPSLYPLAANGNGDTVYAVVRDRVLDDTALWIGNIRNEEWLPVPGPLAAVIEAVLRGAADDVVGLFGQMWLLEPRFDSITPEDLGRT